MHDRRVGKAGGNRSVDDLLLASNSSDAKAMAKPSKIHVVAAKNTLRHLLLQMIVVYGEP